MPAGLIKDRPYIAAARETGDLAIGSYTLTRGSKLPVLPLSYPFRAVDGEWKGILVATLDLNWLSRHLAELPGTENAAISVADRNGVFLARNLDASRYIGQSFRSEAIGPVHAAQPGTAELPGIDGVERIVGYVPSTVSPGGVYVGAGIDRTIAMRSVNLETSVELLCILASILLALFAGWIGSGRFARLQRRMLARTAELETEREQRAQIEAVLAQSQKLEAVGQLTAGLAHDFNNLLAVVLGNLELARGGLREKGKTDRLLERAMEAADRGAGLTQKLLAFARNQKLAIEPADANQVIEGVQDLLERSVGPAIRIRNDLAPDTASVLVDRGQLEVALLNLVLNARDAMPLGGTITLSTRNADPRALPPDLSPGDYVQIRVTDDGPGMTAEVKARAFEPFYTTKEIGKGSGLGLAQVFGIARQSGGTVSLRSEPARGTAVTIYLPRSRAPAEKTPREETRKLPIEQLRRLRVLLVDDDPDVRSTMANMLVSLDLTVKEFSSGAAALDHLARDHRCDVLITDFAMPEMNGAELAHRAADLVPGLKILVVTGFAMGRDEAELSWPVLRKPFKTTDIEAALIELGAETGKVVQLIAQHPQ